MKNDNVKVKVTRTYLIEMPQEDLEMLRESCDDGERQMLEETVGWESDEVKITKMCKTNCGEPAEADRYQFCFNCWKAQDPRFQK